MASRPVDPVTMKINYLPTIESIPLNRTSVKPILEPLMFAESAPAGTISSENQESRVSSTSSTKVVCPCLFCDDQFSLEEEEQIFHHLMMKHKFIIADTKLIADLRGYLLYWKERLKEQPATDFCSVINATTQDQDQDKTTSVEEYYLLSDMAPEDKELRQFLQKRKLEKILSVQQTERDDTTFSKSCLFCRQHFTGNRSLLFDHMAEDHGFNIGQVDNIVFSNELLDKLKEKLDNLLCLFCEKTFKDRLTLKEHMRKKQHKTINPQNTEYDKFYVINYLELGKNWKTIHSENDRGISLEDDDTDAEEEWSQWEDTAGSQATCLFCEFVSSNCVRLKMHMQELHDFDLTELKLRLDLSFYQQVKLINYIRRQVHLGTCYGCEGTFDSKHALLEHMHTDGHTNSIPRPSVWDRPEYYFPTYENDNLLCQLEDSDDEKETRDVPGCVKVIAEDNKVLESILTDETLRQDILTNT
ncbi:hypothetical protein ScPMuIL_009564 [Solemya velum]